MITYEILTKVSPLGEKLDCEPPRIYLQNIGDSYHLRQPEQVTNDEITMIEKEFYFYSDPSSCYYGDGFGKGGVYGCYYGNNQASTGWGVLNYFLTNYDRRMGSGTSNGGGFSGGADFFLGTYDWYQQ